MSDDSDSSTSEDDRFDRDFDKMYRQKILNQQNKMYQFLQKVFLIRNKG